MHIRWFSEPLSLSVASQLHCVPVSGRSTVQFPATHFIAQARSRFPSVLGVVIQAQILHMNTRTATVQVLYDAQFWLLNYGSRTGSKPSKTTEYPQARSRFTFPNWCHDSNPSRHSSLTWCWTLTPKPCSKFTQGRHTVDGCACLYRNFDERNPKLRDGITVNVIETCCTFLLFIWYRSDDRRLHVMVSWNANFLDCGLLQPRERMENNIVLLRLTQHGRYLWHPRSGWWENVGGKGFYQKQGSQFACLWCTRTNIIPPQVCPLRGVDPLNFRVRGALYKKFDLGTYYNAKMSLSVIPAGHSADNKQKVHTTKTGNISDYAMTIW